MNPQFLFKALVLWLICLGSAQADTLCGRYVWKHYGMTEVLDFYSDNTYSAPSLDSNGKGWFNNRGRYQIQGDQLALVDWVYLGSTKFARLSSNQKNITFYEGSTAQYVKTASPCVNNPFPNQIARTKPFPINTTDRRASCAQGNESDCLLIANLESNVAVMKTHCDQGIPMACEGLFKAQLRIDRKNFDDTPDDPQWHPAYGEIHLPTQTLEQLGEFCTKTMPSKLCEEYADALWSKKRFAQAFEQVALNCKHAISDVQCARAASIDRAQRAAILNTQFSEKMPRCGKYHSKHTSGDFELDANGVMRFPYGGDKATGQLTFQGGELRTQLADGNHVAFVVLGNGALVGINQWDTFNVYQKASGKVDNCRP